MVSRKERLEGAAEHARKLINEHPDFDRRSIYHALEEYIILQWGSSLSTRKDYVLSVAAMLKEELAKRDSEMESKIPKLDNNLGFLYGKPSSVVSKEKVFMEIFQNLVGQENGVVENKRLVSELLKSSMFQDEEDTKKYIQKFNREGRIYEKRIGIWTKA